MDSTITYLDPEIANEGVSADEWTPTVPEARIPDYRGIKAIAKYFPQFTGRPYRHQVFPCWFYHPNGDKRLVEDKHGPDGKIERSAEDQAKKLGCAYRQSTSEELSMGFPPRRWEYSAEWRATPFSVKFDPQKPDTGKLVVFPTAAKDGNAELIASAIAAAMATLKQPAPSAAPASSDPDWAEFLAFKAWKAQQDAAPASANALSAEEPALDKTALLEQARARGLKLDGRLSAEKILAELEKGL